MQYAVILIGLIIIMAFYIASKRNTAFYAPSIYSNKAYLNQSDIAQRVDAALSASAPHATQLGRHANTIGVVDRSDTRQPDFGIPTATQPGWQEWEPAKPVIVTDPHSPETDIGEQRNYAPGGIVDEQYLPVYYPDRVWQTATPNNVFDKRSAAYLLSNWRLNVLNETGRPAVPATNRPAGFKDKQFSGYYGAVLMNVVRDADYEYPEKIRPGFNLQNSMTYWMQTDSPIDAAFWPKDGPAIYPGGGL
jgi:hypothetical protein